MPPENIELARRLIKKLQPYQISKNSKIKLKKPTLKLSNKFYQF